MGETRFFRVVIFMLTVMAMSVMLAGAAYAADKTGNASGTYTYSSGLFKMTWTASDKVCDVSQAGYIDTAAVTTLTSTTMTMTLISASGDTMTFTRIGTGSDIVGTWKRTRLDGYSDTLIMNSDGTFSLVKTCSGDKYTVWGGTDHQQWDNKYYGNFQIKDSSHAIQSIAVTASNGNAVMTDCDDGKGQQQLSLAYNNGSGGWREDPCGVAYGTTPPSNQQYIITITDSAGQEAHNVTIDGGVTEFPSNLSPSGTVSGSLTFSFAGISGGALYSVDFHGVDASGNSTGFDWSSGNKDTFTTIAYTGDPLPAGDYVYEVVSKIGSNNSTTSVGHFTCSSTCTAGNVALVVTKSGTGSGAVSSSPSGILCGDTCSAQFSANSTVTLTAQADNGSTFMGWSGACSGSGTGSCQVKMSASRNVGAIFMASSTPVNGACGPANGQASYITPSAGSLCSSGSASALVSSSSWTWTCAGSNGGTTVNCSATQLNANAPITTAYPGGGVFTSAKSVTLTANKTAAIYYTTDGSTPTTSSSVYSSAISITSTTTLKFFAVDGSGNSEAVRTETYTITSVSTGDTVPPATTASPEGGSYSSAQTVTLSCSDSGGCAATFYSIDGTTPTTSSAVYTGPVTIGKTTILKFFSLDTSGNAEPVKTKVYVITSSSTDTEPPVVAISAPINGATVSSLYLLTGTAYDAMSSTAKVEVQVTDGTYYLNADNKFVTEAAWIEAAGTGKWSFNTGRVNWVDGTTYSVKARATDTKGNTSDATTVIFTKSAKTTPSTTSITLDVLTQTLLKNAAIDVTGKLTLNPDTGTSLKDIAVKVKVVLPDGTSSTQTTTTYDDNGRYKLNSLSVFTQEGAYTVQASFEGTTALYPSISGTKSVTVGAAAGYAIIVEGKIPSGEGQSSYNKTAARIYGKLRTRGFSEDDIYYFNFDNSQTGVDTTPVKAQIQSAIVTWAKDRMNAAPAPLYIIFVNHGSKGKFHINKEEIKPQDLDGWLDTLEAGLSEAALKEDRVVIIGSCYSGSFIPTLSKSGRIIITSAAADEVSYRGPLEKDNVRSGEFFLDQLFNSLAKGESFKEAFGHANDMVKMVTKKGGKLGNSNSKYFDNSLQHPLLDDNGDGKGSNKPAAGGDGNRAKDLYLGTGDVNGAPAVKITGTAGTVYLNASTSSALLWATSSNDSAVGSAWIEVRSPSKKLASQSGNAQAAIDLPTATMSFNAGSSRWEATYYSFTEPGRYEIYYYVRDAGTLEVSAVKMSAVYKGKSGNTAPAPFGLISPEDVSEQTSVLTLDWDDSVDPDGDAVTYTLLVSRDKNFGTTDYMQEEIPCSKTWITGDAGLLDLTTYYWKILAVDAYGAIRSSGVRSFTTNGTNGLAGIVFGNILDADSGAPVASANISSITSGDSSSLDDGFYIMNVDTGSMTLTVKAAGYETKSLDLDVSPGDTIEENISLKANSSAGQQGYTLTITRSGSGSGGVTVVSPGTGCGTDCYTYAANTAKPSKVKLTAKPAPGSKFIGWYGGDCSGISPVCAVTMKASKSVTANFGQPALEVSDELDLGEVQKGQTGTAALTITNSGDVKLLVKGFKFTGKDAKLFKVRDKSTKKPVSSATIPAGGSLTVEVTFTPNTAEGKSATLRITSDDPDSPKDITLSGTGK